MLFGGRYCCEAPLNNRVGKTDGHIEAHAYGRQEDEIISVWKRIDKGSSLDRVPLN